MFNDLAAPSGGKGIDIDTFKQFSQFSDMVAERAFVLFSTKKPGLIDLEGIYYFILDNKHLHFLFLFHNIYMHFLEL